MGSGQSGIFNLVTIIFLVLSLVAIIIVVATLLGPPPAPDEAALLLPTLVPSETPSPTNTPGPPTLPPTFTFTPSATATATNTPTDTPTTAPSATITDTPGPTNTPSDTPTPSISPTPSPTFTPTGPTETFTPSLSPFLYDLRDGQVILSTNFANSAGCAWQGIGGQVFDAVGNEINGPVSGLQVHIFGGGIDRFVAVGSNSIYGLLSGWEQAVDNKINANIYFVELQTTAGTVVSPRVEVGFPADCSQNVALVRFIQTR
jgi:hypothetical protein